MRLDRQHDFLRFALQGQHFVRLLGPRTVDEAQGRRLDPDSVEAGRVVPVTPVTRGRAMVKVSLPASGGPPLRLTVSNVPRGLSRRPICDP